MDDWRKALREIDESVACASDAIHLGFDRWMSLRFAQGRKMASLTPSVVYHAGHRGVHTDDIDLNVDYCGPTDNIVVER